MRDENVRFIISRMDDQFSKVHKEIVHLREEVVKLKSWKSGITKGAVAVGTVFGGIISFIAHKLIN